MNSRKVLIKARTQLVLDAPFFGSLALRLSLIEDVKTETAYTNGEMIRYNPDFISGLNLSEVKGLVAHEVMHLACLHHTRRNDRDPTKWNVACDYAMNEILLDAGFTLPEGALLDSQYTNLAAESIYDRLPDECRPSQFGEVRDAPTTPGQNTKAVEAHWKVAVSQAAHQARAMDNLPEGIDRLVSKIVNTTVDWRDLLRHFLEVDSRSDYAWLPPSRRYTSCGIYLPSLHAKEPGEIVVAVDTSGSINDRLLAQFGAEVSGLLEDYNATIYVVYCDTKVQGIQTVDRQDLPLKLKAKGGGGTDFRPVFEWVEKECVTPFCLLYLTDLESHRFPEKDPDYPVLWLSTNHGRHHVPFGQVVDIN